jgi:hypothetical protein
MGKRSVRNTAVTLRDRLGWLTLSEIKHRLRGLAGSAFWSQRGREVSDDRLTGLLDQRFPVVWNALRCLFV